MLYHGVFCTIAIVVVWELYQPFVRIGSFPLPEDVIGFWNLQIGVWKEFASVPLYFLIIIKIPAVAKEDSTSYKYSS